MDQSTNIILVHCRKNIFNTVCTLNMFSIKSINFSSLCVHVFKNIFNTVCTLNMFFIKSINFSSFCVHVSHLKEMNVLQSYTTYISFRLHVCYHMMSLFSASSAMGGLGFDCIWPFFFLLDFLIGWIVTSCGENQRG